MTTNEYPEPIDPNITQYHKIYSMAVGDYLRSRPANPVWASLCRLYSGAERRLHIGRYKEFHRVIITYEFFTEDDYEEFQEISHKLDDLLDEQYGIYCLAYEGEPDY